MASVRRVTPSYPEGALSIYGSEAQGGVVQLRQASHRLDAAIGWRFLEPGSQRIVLLKPFAEVGAPDFAIEDAGRPQRPGRNAGDGASVGGVDELPHTGVPIAP
jgi:hypothetical protein